MRGASPNEIRADKFRRPNKMGPFPMERGSEKGGGAPAHSTLGRVKTLELPPNTAGLAQGGWKLRGGGGWVALIS